MSFAFPTPTPIFPFLRLGYPIKFQPMAQSDVHTATDGTETRCINRAYPLWGFDLTFELLADQTQNASPDTRYGVAGQKELEEISQLFLSCRGRYGRFYYSFPEDNSRWSQKLGVGNGVLTTFTAVRGLGLSGYVEPVGGIENLQAVYVNGLPLASTAFSFTDNVISLTSPPGAGAIVSADFSFFYFCRWADDLQDYEQFMRRLWTQKSCKFQSVKR